MFDGNAAMINLRTMGRMLWQVKGEVISFYGSYVTFESATVLQCEV